MLHNLTKSPRLSNQDGISGHSATATSNDRGFHPSVFSPGVYEDIIEPFLESYEARAVSPTPSLEDDVCVSRHEEEEPLPAEIVRCPFDDCNFSHSVDRTQATLECEGSWKCHVFDVHWPQGSRNWQVCQLGRCGLPQRSRSSAWKHLAVHARKFRVDCPVKTCTASFSRGDRLPQHMREKHAGQGPQ